MGAGLWRSWAYATLVVDATYARTVTMLESDRVRHMDEASRGGIAVE